MLILHTLKRNLRMDSRHGLRRPIPGRFSLLCVFGVAFVHAVCVDVSPGQTQPPLAGQTVVQRPTRESLEAAKAGIDAVAELDEAAKAKAKENYENALKALDSLETTEKSAADFAARKDQVSQLIRQIQIQLGGSFAKQPVTAPGSSELADLQQSLSEAQEAYDGKLADLEAVQAERANRQTRRGEIPQQITQAEEAKAERDRELTAPPVEGLPAQLVNSRRALLHLQRLQAQVLKAQLENELAYYESSSNVSLLQKQQELLEKQVDVAKDKLDQWQKIVDDRRQSDAEDQVKVAQQLFESVPKALQPKAQEVVDLANDRKELAANMAATIRQRSAIEKQLADLKAEYQRIESTVEDVGLTESIGQLLRNIRDSMPSVTEQEQRQQQAQRKMRTIHLEQFQIEDRLDDLSDMPAALDALLADQPGVGEELREQAQQVLSLEQEYLLQLSLDYETYFTDLVEVDTKTVQLIAQIEEYQQFIDERVLWIRSAELPSQADLKQIQEAATWLFARPKVWGDLVLALGWDAIENPIVALLAILAFGSWIISRRKARSKLKEIGRETSRGNTQSVAPTLQSAALTFYLAAIYPAVLLFLAWRLSSLEQLGDIVDRARMIQVVELSRAVAAGLTEISILMFVLELWRQVCRSDGLAEAHFQWSSRALKRLRSALFLFICAGVPLLFAYAAIAAVENERWHNSFGRLAFCSTLVVTLLFMQRVMNVKSGVFREHFAFRCESWISRLKYFWWGAALIAPFTMLVATIVGFFYTAEHLVAYWFSTLAYLSGLLLVAALLKRWIVVNRRRLAIQRARELRAAAQAALSTGESGSEAAVAAAAVAAEPEFDLPKIDLQTRRLIRSVLTVAAVAGVWLIWVNVLPALGILNKVELWDATEVVTVQQPAQPGGGQSTIETTEQIRAISLGDIVFALVIAAVIIVAAVNFPGVMEMLLLQRLPLQHGVRYAITTVSRYVIIVVGVILCSTQIGIGWSNVQWLIAALGVGLGFGLQEIFANFVSGLIILFERPVRIGDIVTVGDVSGIVTKIRIRATTITDWDRKEYIVPNKEFVTGHVLNWTLTDSVSRVLLNIGVAYGSDTKRVRELLYEIAHEHENILAEPPPMVTFEGFGDSTLDFVVRAYLPSVENRLQTIHDLHEAIDLKFRDEGIEIAFPQQDLHLRTQDAAFRIEQIHEHTLPVSNGKGHSSEKPPA